LGTRGMETQLLNRNSLDINNKQADVGEITSAFETRVSYLCVLNI